MKDYRLAALEEEPDLVLWVVCMTPLRYSVILECLDGVLRVSKMTRVSACLCE